MQVTLSETGDVEVAEDCNSKVLQYHTWKQQIQDMICISYAGKNATQASVH
jgi:hypothetical protein